jgi:transposase
MKKMTYKTVKINDADRARLAAELRGRAVAVGDDVAKETHCAALVEAASGRTVVTLAWKSPGQTRAFVELLCGLGAASLVVALEPTGTYGDALRHQLARAGITVFRVSPKRAHDACEVFDGVPSSHDPKMAALLATLHLQGVSEPWPPDEPVERDVHALVERLARCTAAAQVPQNQLEAQLARHWPEAAALLALDSTSLLALLAEFGGPAPIAQQPAKARRLLAKAGGGRLSAEKIDAVLAAAAQTVGVPPTAHERAALQDLAAELARLLKRESAARAALRPLAQSQSGLAAMAAVAGDATAAVLYSEVGDPRRFAGAAAYEKAAGLNLKERSSGQFEGQKKISKRGSGRARQWLYLAVLRLIQTEAAFREWYARKVARDGGKTKKKALVALMRKLIRALWHVGQGEAFDAAKLFDLRRLGLA